MSLVWRDARDEFVAEVERAASCRDRMKGLLGRDTLAPGRALQLVPCNHVHTCWMRFTLDLVFLDRSGRILKVARRVGPWRLAWGGWRAHSVLELASGWLPETAARVGEQAVLVHSQ